MQYHKERIPQVIWMIKECIADANFNKVTLEYNCINIITKAQITNDRATVHTCTMWRCLVVVNYIAGLSGCEPSAMPLMFGPGSD